jgi:transcriptional regulator with XRE-family HTH domain
MNGKQLAALLFCSPATVSRLLSSDREPSVALMLRIRELTGWTLDEQVNAASRGEYGTLLQNWMANAPAERT